MGIISSTMALSTAMSVGTGTVLISHLMSVLLKKPPAKPTVGQQVAEFVTTWVPVCSGLLPSFLLVGTGSVQETMSYFKPLALNAGIVNSIMSMLYNILAQKEKLTLNVFLANGIIVGSNVSMSMIYLADHSKLKAYVAGGLSLLGLCSVSGISSWTPQVPSAVKEFFLFSAVCSYFVTHVIQLIDLGISEKKRWTVPIGVAMNLQTFVLSISSFAMVYLYSPDDRYTQITSVLGAVFTILESVVLYVFNDVKARSNDTIDMPHLEDELTPPSGLTPNGANPTPPQVVVNMPPLRSGWARAKAAVMGRLGRVAEGGHES